MLGLVPVRKWFCKLVIWVLRRGSFRIKMGIILQVFYEVESVKMQYTPCIHPLFHSVLGLGCEPK